jgi:hypothetical protein
MGIEKSVGCNLHFQKSAELKPSTDQVQNMKKILRDLFDHMVRTDIWVEKIYLIPKDGKLIAYGRIEEKPKKSKKKNKESENEKRERFGFINAVSISDFDCLDQSCYIMTEDLIKISKRGFFKQTNIKGANFEFIINGIEDDQYVLKIVSEDGSINTVFYLPLAPSAESTFIKFIDKPKYGIEWMPTKSAVQRMKAQAKVAGHVNFLIENDNLVARFSEDNISGYCVLHPHPIKKLSNALPYSDIFFDARMICSALSSLGIKKVLIEERDSFFEIQCRSDDFNYNYYILALQNT